jgi:hypothetical protein
MFLSLGAAVKGNIEALKADFKAEPPFAFVDVSNLEGPIVNIWTAFVDYMTAL